MIEKIGMGEMKEIVCRTLFLIIMLVIIFATAGCTESANEDTAAEIEVTVEEEVPTATPTEETPAVDMNEVVAIDLVTMYQDIQSDNPLAFEYEILPTCCLGVNDKGDYEFEGIISDFSKDGDLSNYLGVLFTVKDDESGTGYHEWVYKGLKYNVFGGEDGQNITMKFTVDKEDIPEGKTIIMTGYDFYRL